MISKSVPTPKVRPKNLTIGGRYFYGKIQFRIKEAYCKGIFRR